LKKNPHYFGQGDVHNQMGRKNKKKQVKLRFLQEWNAMQLYSSTDGDVRIFTVA